MAMIALIASAAGCGPGKLLDAPPELPTELNGRRLWHTPRAYIYAAEEATAGETDRWIAELAAHVRRTYKAELGKGLVVVIDKDEPPFVRSFEELIRLQRRTARAAAVEQHELPDDETHRRRLAGAGMTEELACRVTPFELDAKAIADGGLPGPMPNDLAWSISCPSESLMEKSMWQFGPKAIEEKHGKSFAVATFWAWPVAFAEAAKGFRLGRDVLVFELWTIRQDEWPIEKRRKAIRRYTDERALVLSPTLALALKIARGEENGPRNDEAHNNDDQTTSGESTDTAPVDH